MEGHSYRESRGTSGVGYEQDVDDKVDEGIHEWTMDRDEMRDIKKNRPISMVNITQLHIHPHDMPIIPQSDTL